jgi:hypothetical protein
MGWVQFFSHFISINTILYTGVLPTADFFTDIDNTCLTVQNSCALRAEMGQLS